MNFIVIILNLRIYKSDFRMYGVASRICGFTYM